MAIGSNTGSASIAWADLGLKTNPFPNRQADATAPEGFTQKEVFALCDQMTRLQVFTGITGVGKTTHAKLLAKHFLKNKRRPTQLITASKTIKASGLLKMICCRFNIELPPGDIVDALKIDTVRRMIQKRKEGISLIIDDAQNLSQEALVSVLRLASLQQEPIKLQLVLFGLPIIVDRCRKSWDDLGVKEDFPQGLIRSWGSDQTESYIVARLKGSGFQNYRKICRKTCQQIHQLSGGVPVQINRRANMMLDQLIKGHAKQASAKPLKGSVLWVVAVITSATAGYLCIKSLQAPYAESVPSWVADQGLAETLAAERNMDAFDKELIQTSGEESMFVDMDNQAVDLGFVDPVLEAVSLLDAVEAESNNDAISNLDVLELDATLARVEAEVSHVSMDDTPTLSFGDKEDVWVKDSDGYTVQVMATPDKNEAFNAAKKYDSSHVVHAARQDKETYLVLVGNFPSVSDAKVLVDDLTMADSNAHPWVRQFNQLRSDVDHLLHLGEDDNS